MIGWFACVSIYIIAYFDRGGEYRAQKETVYMDGSSWLWEVMLIWWILTSYVSCFCFFKMFYDLICLYWLKWYLLVFLAEAYVKCFHFRRSTTLHSHSCRLYIFSYWILDQLSFWDLLYVHVQIIIMIFFFSVGLACQAPICWKRAKNTGKWTCIEISLLPHQLSL